MFGAISYLQIVTGVSATGSGLLLPLIAGLLVTSISSGRLIARPHRKSRPHPPRSGAPRLPHRWNNPPAE